MRVRLISFHLKSCIDRPVWLQVASAVVPKCYYKQRHFVVVILNTRQAGILPFSKQQFGKVGCDIFRSPSTFIFLYFVHPRGYTFLRSIHRGAFNGIDADRTSILHL